MLKEEEEGYNSKTSWLRRFTGEEINCPVCNVVVGGDQDVVDAHVDACLAHESQRLEEAGQREALHQSALEEEHWEDPDDNGGYVGDIRGKFSLIYLLSTSLPKLFDKALDFINEQMMSVWTKT